MSRKIISLVLSLCFIFQQTGLAHAAAVEFNLSGYFARMASSMDVDKFRPIHLRYFSYDSLNNSFKLLLDKGDFQKDQKGTSSKGTPSDVSGEHGVSSLQEETQKLLNYFLIGITLPNDKFWVNLRPDSPSQIIDFNLEETDIGKIMLEADLQLKKDTAQFTSPQTPEGKEYWNRLYKKAGEIYGSENITIPTLTRPWIVPNEIIVRETKDSAYIYKATLKVMLEQDYLKDSSAYNFKDSRAKALNEYSSQLIRELIIPKLTKEINLSKRYAPLRQVYYSLILSRWFKSRFYGKSGVYASLIDKNDLTNLTSKDTWSKSTYFNAYKKSFADGEYNTKEPVYTPSGQTIRSYFSGGVDVGSPLTQAITNRINIPEGPDMFNALLRRMNMAPFYGDSLELQFTGSLTQSATNTLRTNLINGLSEQGYTLNSTFAYWVISITPPFVDKLSFPKEDTIAILKAFIFAANLMGGKDTPIDPNPYIEKANRNINTFINQYLNKQGFRGRLGVKRIDAIKNAALVPFKYMLANKTLFPDDDWSAQRTKQVLDAISEVVQTALDIAFGTSRMQPAELKTASSAMQIEVAIGQYERNLNIWFNRLKNSGLTETDISAAKDILGEFQIVKDTLRTDAKKTINFLINFLERDIILRLSQADREDLDRQEKQKHKADLLKMFPMLPESIIMLPESRRLIEASRSLLEQIKLSASAETPNASSPVELKVGSKFSPKNRTEHEMVIIGDLKDRWEIKLITTPVENQINNIYHIPKTTVNDFLEEEYTLPEIQSMLVLYKVQLRTDSVTLTEPGASSAVYNKFLSRETEEDITDYIDSQPTRYMREQARSEIEERLGNEYTPRDISATLNNFFEEKQGTRRDKSYIFSNGIVISQKRSSSSMDKTGGIDFKHQSMASATTYEAMGSFAGLDFSLPQLSSETLLSFNLNKEESDISQAIDNGIIVSGQRLKEFMAASAVKGELIQKRDTVITWLAKLGILEETTCCTQESSKEYKEALVIADSA